MKLSSSYRAIALLTAVAMVGLARPASAAQEHKFTVRGTWAVTVVHNQLDGTRTGVASPGGPVNGIFSGIQVKNDAWGVGRLDFGNGDTLTYDFEATFDPSVGALVGTWVVTGGTGKYTGATGSGTSFGPVTGFGTGEFEYDGIVSY